jgi:predicted DNA-binding transcriptional regulator AlpA
MAKIGDMDSRISYVVTLTVQLDRVIDDEVARDVAARWATNSGFDLGMTSTSLDEPWLRASAGLQTTPTADPVQVVTSAVGNLSIELREVGHKVEAWRAVEIISADEQARRGRTRGMPDLVNAEQFAELAGLTRQRIYQYLSDRRAGKRADFPEQVLDGYWLRSTAEHWATNRKRKPGPDPRSATEGKR